MTAVAISAAAIVIALGIIGICGELRAIRHVLESIRETIWSKP